MDQTPLKNLFVKNPMDYTAVDTGPHINDQSNLNINIEHALIHEKKG